MYIIIIKLMINKYNKHIYFLKINMHQSIELKIARRRLRREFEFWSVIFRNKFFSDLKRLINIKLKNIKDCVLFSLKKFYE